MFSSSSPSSPSSFPPLPRYWLLLAVVLFQSRADVISMLRWIDPRLTGSLEGAPEEALPGEGACAFTAANLWSRVDVFVVAHFLGWVVKSLMFRSFYLSWLCSILWEVTEVLFAPLLPNFVECWWDQLIFDVLVCNGLGIYVGCKLCAYLEAKEYTWTGIKEIAGLRGKAKRVALQFTPESWTKVAWEPATSTRRYVGVCLLVLGVIANELNAFFLKAIFGVPASNVLNLYRIILWSFVSMPAIRQVYLFTSDPSCDRLGAHADVGIAVLLTELLVVYKHGTESGQFPRADVVRVLIEWGVFLVVATIACTWLLRRIRKREDGGAKDR